MRPVPVPAEDVAAVLTPLRPASSHESVVLYALYVKTMEAAGRPVATRKMFGRALTRYGCRRRVIKRGRGKRGQQVRTETPVWELPGRHPSLPPEDDVAALVRDMGPGFHPSETVYRRYLQLKRTGEPLRRAALMTHLTRRGYLEVRSKSRDKRKPAELCRDFH